MHTDRIWLLIGRKLANEASAEELQELERLLRSHPETHFPLQVLSDSWSGTQNDTDPETPLAYSRHLHKMQEQGLTPIHTEAADIDENAFLLEGSRRRKPWKTVLLASLSICIVLLLVNWWYTPAVSKPPAVPQSAAVVSEVSTKFGSKSKIVLPDGSQVWLNAGSKLTYDENFNKNLREVRLTGEAFFDVVKNTKKPFIIHVADVDIKVLGTRFNVKSYPGDRLTEAALIHGKIEVSVKSRDQEKFILHPNEKIVVKNDTTVITKEETAAGNKTASAALPTIAIHHLTYQQKDSAILETSWVDNKLIFQDESFEDIAVKMERWYGVNIQFKNKNLQKERLTGSFQNETIAQALKALRITTPFNFKIDNNTITISN